MIVSSLRRLAARILDQAAEWLDPVEDDPETIKTEPRLVPYQLVPRRVLIPVQTFRPDPALVADMDAIEAEFEDFLLALDDEDTRPEYLN